METIHKVVDAAARTIYGSESYDEEIKSTTQDGKAYKPTEHQIRDETTATPPPAEHRLPTQGPGKAVYLDKPIVTTTSETSKLSEESPSFENLSLRSSSPPLKDTAAKGHRRVDSGVAEAEDIAERSTTAGVQHGAHQIYGYEKADDDGIQRTAGEIDAESHTTEGYPRPKFVGNERNEDGIRRADGRDRVQFDNPTGSTGNLKPSGEPSAERPRQGSTGALPYMDLGKQGNLPPGARVGTVQGGTVRDRQQELEDAQTVVFGTGGHDPTGTAQVQNEEYHRWCKPEVRKSTKDSNLRQVKAIVEDLTQTKIAENYPKPEPKYSELPGYISEREKGKRPQEDRCLQGQLPQEKPNSQNTPKTDGSHPNAETGDSQAGAETDGSHRGAETDNSHFDAKTDDSGLDGAETDGSHRGAETDNSHFDAKTDGSHPAETDNSGLDGADNDPKQPHSTMQTSPPSIANTGPQRSEDLFSSNQPHSEKDTNPATTNAISPVGPGLTEGTHGPVDPSVGADPAHAQQPTQKHEGADRPTEEPKGNVPQPGQDKEGSQASQAEAKKKDEAGHKWVKSSGTAAEGGDFDAARPGAGREADRLLEQAGVHRTTDPRPKKRGSVELNKGAKGAQHGTTEPKHHPDSSADGEKKGGLHLPGILHHHHHHDRQKNTAGHEDGSGQHKSLGEKIKEKVKLKKDNE